MPHYLSEFPIKFKNRTFNNYAIPVTWLGRVCEPCCTPHLRTTPVRDIYIHIYQSGKPLSVLTRNPHMYCNNRTQRILRKLKEIVKITTYQLLKGQMCVVEHVINFPTSVFKVAETQLSLLYLIKIYGPVDFGNNFPTLRYFKIT